MKRLRLLSIVILVLMLTACSAQQSPVTGSATEAVTTAASSAPSPLPKLNNISETQLFAEVKNAHGITFNGDSMYVGSNGLEIIKLTPDAQITSFFKVETLADKTDRTRIWQFVFGTDGYLYAAAGDRILKISPQGEAQNYLIDDYEGEWGACNLQFDQAGSMWVVHGSKLERYSSGMEKKTVIDGQIGGRKFQALVGICFDKTYEHLWVSDVFGNQVVKFKVDADGAVEEANAFESLPSAQYMVMDDSSNTYVAIPFEWVIARISEDSEIEKNNGDNLLREVTTIAFGSQAFGEYLFAVSSGKIYALPVKKGDH